MEPKAHNSVESAITLPDPGQVRFPADSIMGAAIQGEFVAHTSTQLEDMERNALQWEANPADSEAADAIGRTLHSIKGDAGFLGLAEVNEVCHQAESALAEARAQGCCSTEMLLAVKDWLQAVIEHLASGREESPIADRQLPTEEIGSGKSAIRSAERALRILVVEDDFTSRRLLERILSPYGHCDVAVDGQEALEAFRLAWEERQPYGLICLDIMMPELDGREVLATIRAWERENGILLGNGVKIVMTTVLHDGQNVFGAFNTGCEAYVVKPIDKRKLLDEIRKLGLIE